MLEKLLKKIQQEIASLKRRFQIKYTDANLSGDAECCQVFGINSTNGNLYYKDDNGQWVLKTVGSGGGFFDAIVDFSGNSDPNHGSAIFNPNSPALTTVLYVSTIDNSQWTYNGTNYVTYNAPFWTIRGNTGTTPGTHFIGTIDDKNLIFKTNNTHAGLIDHQDFNTSLGSYSLEVVSGQGNSAIGYASSTSVNSGSFNTSVGGNSQELNISGDMNTSLGFNSLHGNVSSSNNTAIGVSSLAFNTLGFNNLGLGFSSGQYNTINSNQIFVNSLDRLDYIGDQTKSPIYIQQDALVQNQKIFLNGLMNLSYVPTFADNNSALLGGLVTGNLYKIAIGGGTFNLAVVV